MKKVKDKTGRLEELLGRRAKVAIEAFMKQHDLQTGGCRTFYTPAEWNARRETYGADSLLVVVYDGGDLYSVMNNEHGHGLQDELTKILGRLGLYMEHCTSWCSAVYPIYRGACLNYFFDGASS